MPGTLHLYKPASAPQCDTVSRAPQHTCAAAEGGVSWGDKGPACVLVCLVVRPCALPGGVRDRQTDGVLQALRA
jgi:hypothetical protein